MKALPQGQNRRAPSSSRRGWRWCLRRTGTLRMGDGMLRFCLPLAPALALLMLLAACQPEAGPATDAPLPRYLDQRAADGDTLVIGGERLRLAAIDAPELG